MDPINDQELADYSWVSSFLSDPFAAPFNAPALTGKPRPDYTWALAGVIVGLAFFAVTARK